jgi:hypothetical protein
LGNGGLQGEQLVESFGVKADHDFLADHQRRRGAAVVGADQLKDVSLAGRYVALFELDTSILEVSLNRPARRSARLRENDDLLRHGRNG